MCGPPLYTYRNLTSDSSLLIPLTHEYSCCNLLQHTTHVSQFTFKVFAITHTSIFSSMSANSSSAPLHPHLDPQLGLSTARSCSCTNLRAPVVSYIRSYNNGFMIMLPTLPFFWTSDLLSWLTFMSALWTGSCCQVDPYPSQYPPELSSHRVCETPH